MIDQTELKRIIAVGIGPLTSSTFADRDRAYNEVRRRFTSLGASEAQQAFVEQAIRELEANVVKLSKSNIDDLASRTKLIASLAVPFVGLLFAAVQLKDFPFLRVAGSIPPQHLFALTLSAYYFVIGFGITFDIETQRLIFTVDPDHGRLRTKAFAAIALYFITAAVLFFASRSYILFAVALTLFHFSGIVFWRTLSRVLAPIIVESERSAILRQDYFALERIRLVRWYIRGSWHFWRHLILSILVLLFDLFALPNPLAHYASMQLTSLVSSPSAWADMQIPAIVFLIFALTGECWTMAQRFHVRIQLRTIDALERRYNMEQRTIYDPEDHRGLLPIASV